MTTQRNPENKQEHRPHDLGQIIAVQEQFKNTREQAEEILDGLKGANLMATVRTLNGLTRGSYKVTITQDAEYNEVQCRLRESTRGNPIATGFIDRGHTKESRYEAAEELRELVRAYLCR